MAWLELVDVSVALGKRVVVHGVSAEVGKHRAAMWGR